MLFRQFVDDDLGCASYLIGDEDAGVVAVVDPAFSIEQYLAEAEQRGVRLTLALETHTHADHVSGHGRLALEHGADIAVHPAAEPAFAYVALEDGATVELGAVAITVLHTPGHRPEHSCFAVADRSRSDEPWLVLTGDSLFVGDAARPDLATEAREGAEALFHSLRRLLELEDGVEVYPGHVAGSMCGAAGMSSKPSTTIGFERRFNEMLRVQALEDFVAASTAAAGLRPPNVERIVGLNRGPLIGAPPPLETLHAVDGRVVLDVRPPDEFVRGHVRGAINVPLSGSGFGTKAGFVLSPDEPVALHARDAADAAAAAARLHAVGFFDLATLDSPATDSRLEPVRVDELERLLARGAVDVVDVREADERDGGYIPGSRHVPYRLLRALGDGIGSERPVVTICESGARAGIAASILAARGVDARPVLDGGIGAWRARGNETVGFRRCGGG